MPFGFDRRFRVHKVGMLAIVPLLAACAVPVATVEVEPSVVAGNTLGEVSERLRLAGNSGTTQSVLEHLAGDHSEAVRIQVAANPNTPAAALERLAKDRSKDVRIAVYENPQSSAVIRTIVLGRGYGGSESMVEGLPVVYTVKFIRFRPDTAMSLSRALAGLSGTRSFKTIAIRESSRVYSLETIDPVDLIEDRIYEVLKVQGIDSANIRLEFSDTTMLVENFEI